MFEVSVYERVYIFKANNTFLSVPHTVYTELNMCVYRYVFTHVARCAVYAKTFSVYCSDLIRTYAYTSMNVCVKNFI